MKYKEEVYRRYLDGDSTAIEEIIHTYRENLIFFLTRYTHAPALSEEICEDTFLELLIHPRRYNFSVSLKTYIFAIGRNKAINFMRRHARLLPESEIPPVPDDSDYRALENRYIAAERDREVTVAMQELPEHYATMLHLIYFEGMPCEEAGRVMGKNKKQAENIATRARAALRKKLEERGFSYEN